MSSDLRKIACEIIANTELDAGDWDGWGKAPSVDEAKLADDIVAALTVERARAEKAERERHEALVAGMERAAQIAEGPPLIVNDAGIVRYRGTENGGSWSTDMSLQGYGAGRCMAAQEIRAAIRAMNPPKPESAEPDEALVGRVARAICFAENGCDCVNEQSCAAFYAEDGQHQARAAIRAMRDDTP
jgi:hypothetical protein